MRLTRGDLLESFRECFEELPTRQPELATWVWLADEDLSLPLGGVSSHPPFMVSPYPSPAGWRLAVLHYAGGRFQLPWTVAVFNCPDREAAIGLAGWLGVTLNGAWGKQFPLPQLRVVR